MTVYYVLAYASNVGDGKTPCIASSVFNPTEGQILAEFPVEEIEFDALNYLDNVKIAKANNQKARQQASDFLETHLSQRQSANP